jgi:uncharacterized protein YqeY
MNLKEQIKSSYMEAMREKNTLKKNLFGVILGEIQNQELRGQSIDDEMVLSILKKMEKSLTQTNNEESLQELELIKPYLPQMMEKEHIRRALISLIAGGVPKNMGDLMKSFNFLYKGKADNKIVSEVIKSLI